MIFVLGLVLGFTFFSILDLILGGKMAEDFSKLQSSIAKLQSDVAALVASKSSSNQAAIDAAQAQVDAVDATVVGAIPAPAPPPAA